ncbi:uncharacterized protein STEHIDRAFT_157643 [Stereum hirsutum FP-91666 SS1]|uniref:uncharacterized protein n=1 Tax=Stereum hirsutum (strain FP-91666) TaxID=721885 RepID=UPI000444A281|nr:uncharacterized protein STEHIDRAFT_157643 [Stereum hirsutum FP-91666 SS1]EIM86134.1 hypothetical protein STEHIDRAFT_157643 [Stereum hirsutum FP-91666 SS1]
MRRNLNTGWYWDTVQKPNGQYKLGWTTHYEGVAKHRTGMSTKTRIREIRSRWTATGDLYIPPDPKYNKAPTPHEIRAQVARRREGGKGDAEFLPESVVIEPVESPHVEELDGEEGACENAVGERGRYEVSLLDLPRGRVHRKGKKSTMSVLDGDFEWI